MVAIMVLVVWSYPLNQHQTRTRITLKIFTDAASIELHSHGYMTVPSPRMNTDVAASNGGNKQVGLYRVAVAVTTEILEDNYKAKRFSSGVAKENFCPFRLSLQSENEKFLFRTLACF